MMRVAIPQWQGRVSPVFDVAGHLLVVDVEDGAEQGRRSVVIDAASPQARATAVTDHSAAVLICGAISAPLESGLEAGGVEVISQTCGDVEEVLAAFIEGRLGQETFLMPGCCGRRRRLRADRRRGGRCRKRQRQANKGGDLNA